MKGLNKFSSLFKNPQNKKGIIKTASILSIMLAVIIGVGVVKSKASSVKEIHNTLAQGMDVTIKENSSWQQGSQYFYGYEMIIKNSSEKNITNWNASVTFPESITISQSWCGNYKSDKSTISITPVDYNKNIMKGNNINIGFIIYSDSKIDLDSVKVDFSTDSDNVTPATSAPVTSAPVTNAPETQAPVNPETKAPATDSPATKTPATKAPSSDDTKGGTPVAQHGRLSLSGTNIVDKNGKTFVLKGVSTHGIQWFGEYVNKDAFKTMRDDWNINVVRLAMYTDPNAGYTESMQDLVDKGVSYATDLGLYVIIDWHILSDGNPNTYKDNAIAYFNKVSKKYKDYENVIYEICNEPNGGVTWQNDIKPYAQDVIKTIRANDKNGIIVVGSSTWSQDVDVVAQDPIKGYDNIMYTLHFYAATHKDDLRNKMTSAIKSGLPIFVTEFGICDASGNGGIDYDSANTWIDVMNKNNVSYVIWNLSNKNETSALIDSSCTKTSGWSTSDLSDEGKWFVDIMHK
ncbi:MAG: cellulase family glycosylhydrolase [Lachnospiraceae bacterium]|nr:cellulase family glycosylhydrolase [Lachnospiraceae bacterium]